MRERKGKLLFGEKQRPGTQGQRAGHACCGFPDVSSPDFLPFSLFTELSASVKYMDPSQTLVFTHLSLCPLYRNLLPEAVCIIGGSRLDAPTLGWKGLTRRGVTQDSGEGPDQTVHTTSSL